MEWTGLLQVIHKDLEIYQRYDFLSLESLGFVVGITSLGICTKILFYGTHHQEIQGAFSFSGWGHSEESAHHSIEILRDVKVVFCHRPINSLNVLPHQVPIATKSACKKNVEESGHSFDPNTVCAGGNGKGTCKVFKGTLLFNVIFFLQESNLHGALLGWAESLSGNGACVCVLCMYVRHHIKEDQ